MADYRRVSLRLVILFLVACIASAKASVVVGNTNARCSRTLLGRLRFRAAAKMLEVCDGKMWLSVKMKDIVSYGRRKYPGKSCKDILHNSKGHKYPVHLPDGIYWIKLQGVPYPVSFPVYCDMTSGGWTMAFKQVSGFPQQPTVIWRTPDAIHEWIKDGFYPANTAKNLQSYKNRLVHQWAAFKPSEARVVLYNQGKKALNITFNAQNSTNMNWFTYSRVTDSPWTDLATEPKNYFSIVGASADSRSFFINRNYGGCGVDSGWLVASNRAVCSWEGRYKPLTAFLYSKTGTYTNWNKQKDVGSAEVFTVFLR